MATVGIWQTKAYRAKFDCEVDPERPEHIVQDFQPVFDRFAELGFKEVFRDEWLWGHQVFQKSGQV